MASEDSGVPEDVSEDNGNTFAEPRSFKRTVSITQIEANVDRDQDEESLDNSDEPSGDGNATGAPLTSGYDAVVYDEEEEFDKELESPPNWELVQRYQKASRVMQIDPEKARLEENICEFSHAPTGDAANPYPHCTGTGKLDLLGSGFPMFFAMKKFIIGMLLVLFIIPGLISFITNIGEDDCKEWVAG